MLVGLKERADVDGLAAPEVAVDGPVKRQLQRAFIQDSARGQYLSRTNSNNDIKQDVQGWMAGHGCSGNGQWLLSLSVKSSSSLRSAAGREVDFVLEHGYSGFVRMGFFGPKHKTSPALQQKQDKKNHFSSTTTLSTSLAPSTSTSTSTLVDYQSNT